MRRPVAALAAVLVAVAVLAGFAPPASAAPVTYVAPVSGPVVDPFRPPSTPYGAGNRGLDYATTPGQAVRAAAPGRVTFAGQVGGALHVVVQHTDGVRTSYSFLRTINVRVGQQVKQNDPVGAAANTFHFGARIGDAYIDPAILIASGPSQVHLVPDGEFTEPGAHDDRFSLWQAVKDMPSITARAFAWVARSGFDGLRALTDGTLDLARLAAGTASDAMRATAAHLITLLDQVANMGVAAGPFAALAAALADILQAWIEPCTPPDQDAPTVPPGHIGVFVAGLGSHMNAMRGDGSLSKEINAAGLGYARDDTYDFSYSGDRPPGRYSARDTTDDLRGYAAKLRDLLDQINHDHPGVPVDIIAHSQGGLIAREALADAYNGPAHALPPIAHVVTLSTPNHGADAATWLAWTRWTTEGRSLRRAMHSKYLPLDLSGPGVAQLSETSDFIKNLNARPLPDGVAFTSIASADDLTVPAARARLAGAENVLVDADPGFTLIAGHTAIKHSGKARRELQLALAGLPPTCRPVSSTAARAAIGAFTADAEQLGPILATAG